MGLSADNWIAIYAAGLSTATAFVLAIRFGLEWMRTRRERRKLQTDLYLLNKVDSDSGQEHPIIVVMAANLGDGRIAIRSVEYEGIAKTNSLKIAGTCGWYEQPEELYGIRKRLLPRVLASGEVADFPMLEIGIFTGIQELKIWLTDFTGRRYYLGDGNVQRARRDIQQLSGKSL